MIVGIRLRHIGFTGPNISPATLKFVDGLNIVYGASNTGKSFAAEVVLFALGAAAKLEETDEIKAYDAVWLGVTVANEGEFTLYRPTRGGDLKIYPGLVMSDAKGRGEVLGGRHSHKNKKTVSYRILEALGLQGRWIVTNVSGKKESFSVRLLSKYFVVGEQDIMAKGSPVFLSGIPSKRTLERNIFKLLLTGTDDSSAANGTTESARVAAKKGKLELIDELLAQLDAELNDPPMNMLAARTKLAEIEVTSEATFQAIQHAQIVLDGLVLERRTAKDGADELSARARDLELTLERFSKLQAVYNSDLDRLHAIEEGGRLLTAMTGRDCPVCGAPQAAQKHFHAAEEISMAHLAAAAEARKIEREQRELKHEMESLLFESQNLAARIASLRNETEAFDRLIQALRPSEASLRTTYESFSVERAQLNKLIGLYERRNSFAKRREEIDATQTKRENDAPPVGPDSTVLFDFGEAVKKVLTAWGFPDADKVLFDGDANDITVGGKKRSANGKGVRAVMHAAFKVAVIIHCIDNDLPHPGFLVLDTPLLAYREPKSKHGALSPDEIAMKQTSLAEKFYRHLASLGDKLQVIVIENSDPPAEIEKLAHIEMFTGLDDDGRYGLLEHLSPLL
ncbi:hypothetical protein [Acidovorax sp.]|uniref:hypothetical protein n=1 Tax=Acidovorax sp. TaxID=1872122 RepID=UPI00391F7529